jgi:predicted GH43/DUF377 family glycosyl hydrolase
LNAKKLIMLAAVFLLTFIVLPFGAYADAQWIKFTNNPVLAPTPNSWDAYYTTTPKVIYDGSVYKMWYSGGTTGSSGIGYATSTDGVSWSKHAEPVLVPGQSSAWDSASVALGSVLWNKTLYMMWYTGNNATTFANGAIGLATSKDGVTWTKYLRNPVLSATESDQAYIATPYVIRLGLTYDMWYTGEARKPTRRVSSTLPHTTGPTGVSGLMPSSLHLSIRRRGIPAASTHLQYISTALTSGFGTQAWGRTLQFHRLEWPPHPTEQPGRGTSRIPF